MATIEPGSIIELDGTIVSPSGVRTTLPESAIIMPNGTILSSTGNIIMESGTISSGEASNNALTYNQVSKICNDILLTLTVTPALSLMIVQVISECYVSGKNKDTQKSIDTISNYLNLPVNPNNKEDIRIILNKKVTDIIANIKSQIANDTNLDYNILFTSSSETLSAALETSYKFLAGIFCVLPLIQFTGNGNITMEILVEKLTTVLFNLLTNTTSLNNLININVAFAPVGVNTNLWKSLGGRVNPNAIPPIVESSPTTSTQSGGKRFRKTKKLKKKNKKT